MGSSVEAGCRSGNFSGSFSRERERSQASFPLSSSFLLALLCVRGSSLTLPRDRIAAILSTTELWYLSLTKPTGKNRKGFTKRCVRSWLFPPSLLSRADSIFVLQPLQPSALKKKKTLLNSLSETLAKHLSPTIDSLFLFMAPLSPGSAAIFIPSDVWWFVRAFARSSTVETDVFSHKEYCLVPLWLVVSIWIVEARFVPHSAPSTSQSSP